MLGAGGVMDGELSRRALVTDRTKGTLGSRQGCVRLACEADRGLIGDLRRVAYQSAREFSLSDGAHLGWSDLDEVSAVITAWRGPDLVSTLRATVAEDITAAEGILTCSVELAGTAFPAMVLTKGATRPGRGAGGLHSALRYHCLLAGDRYGVRSVLGLVYTDAPRVRTMAELGYEFRRPARVWDPEGSALTQPLFAVLPGDRLKAAIGTLASAFEETLAAYPWVGPPPVLPSHRAVR
jgi:hypothetical protein